MNVWSGFYCLRSFSFLPETNRGSIGVKGSLVRKLEDVWRNRRASQQGTHCGQVQFDLGKVPMFKVFSSSTLDRCNFKWFLFFWGNVPHQYL